jgi:hypothetical protein
MLGTRQLRCTCHLTLAGAAARVRRDLAVVAAAGAGALSAQAQTVYVPTASAAHWATPPALTETAVVGWWLIARAPIGRRKRHLRGLVVEVTRGRELDWAALGICCRWAETYRVQGTRRLAARQGNRDREDSQEENREAVISHADLLPRRTLGKNSVCLLSTISRHSRVARGCRDQA